MQGRLTPPETGRFQSFPHQRWRDEFPRARQAGLSCIEWIQDEYGRTANPIFSAHGVDEIASLRESHGIATPALCGDWFMDFPLIRCTAAERDTRESHLLALIPVVHRMGATRLILPFVDNSRMMNQDEQQTVREILQRALPVAGAVRRSPSASCSLVSTACCSPISSSGRRFCRVFSARRWPWPALAGLLFCMLRWPSHCSPTIRLLAWEK